MCLFHHAADYDVQFLCHSSLRENNRTFEHMNPTGLYHISEILLGDPMLCSGVAEGNHLGHAHWIPKTKVAIYN